MTATARQPHPTGGGAAPRPHQRQALDAITAVLAAPGSRGQLLMACGTGKTLTAAWAATELGARTVLVATPSLLLLAQTLEQWRRIHPGMDAIVVCSDPTTARRGRPRPLGDSIEDGSDFDADDQDHLPARTTVPVTTNPYDLARTLGTSHRGLRVVFTTYQSAPVVAAALAACRTPVRFDLLVADEAHRLAGRSSPAYRTVLDDGAVPADRRLFMTATPVVGATPVSGVVFTGDARQILSMRDEATFGPVIHELTFGAAVRAGLLSDYRIVVVGVPAGETDATAALDRGQIATLALQTAILNHGATRILTFHSRVASAHAFADAFPSRLRRGRSTLRVQAAAVAGATPAAVRAAALSDLAAPLASPGVGADLPHVRVLASARCLSEGVDVPAVDAALYADPRRSVVDIAQSLGRVLRRADGKDRGLIVIPVPVPDTADGTVDGDPEDALATSRFTHVWSVLRALRAHDERLKVTLERLGRSNGRAPSTTADDLITFVLPDGIDVAAFAGLVAGGVGTAWEQAYRRLQDWVETHGHARVPGRTSVAGFPLGLWVAQQRTRHRRELLSTDRVAALEALDGWAWSGRDATTWRTVDILHRLAANGLDVSDAAALDGHYDGANLPLGTTVARFRQAHRDQLLEADVAAALEGLPGWRWQLVDDIDAAGVDALRAFVEWEQHTEPPRGHVEDTATGPVELATWLEQVRLRRAVVGLPRALEHELLAATPPTEHPGRLRWRTARSQWRAGLLALRAFTGREGTARVPSRHVEPLPALGPDASVALGQWCAARRHDYRTGRLHPLKMAALETLPGWTWHTPWASAGADRSPLPIDLGPKVAHGTPLGWDRGCGCPPCANSDRTMRAARRAQREVADLSTAETLVPADAARARLVELADAGYPRAAVARAVDATPVMVRRIVSGALPAIPVDLDRVILATGPAQVDRWVAPTGSRGRLRVLDKPAAPASGRAAAPAPRAKRRPVVTPAGAAQARRREATWRACYDLLAAWAAEHGHAAPAGQVRVQGRNLTGWVREQRTTWREGRMPADRRALLEALPGWTWRARADAWDRGYDRLVAFATEHGHANVPQQHRDGDGYYLGAWVASQRRARNAGDLAPGLAVRFEALPGWVWDTSHDADFEAGIAALQAYTTQTGRACPTAVHRMPDGFQLGRWVARTRHRRANLPADRIARLEALPGWTWDPFEDAWQARYRALAAFTARNGHPFVPADHHEPDPQAPEADLLPIGRWVGQQRTAARSESMPAHRRAAFEALPEWTWDGYEARRQTAQRKTTLVPAGPAPARRVA